MEFLEYWYLIRKRLWLILLLMAAALAYTAYTNAQQIPRYRTTTTLFLNPASPSPLLPQPASRTAESLANTYAEFMRTRSFAQLVAEATNDGTSLSEALDAISTRYVPDTQFFKITATHTDPAKAQELANTAAQTLIAENIARQQAQQAQIEAQQDPVRAQEEERLRRLQESLQNKLDYYDERVDQLQARIQELEQGPPSDAVDEQILSLSDELTRSESLSMEALSSLGQIQASIAGTSDTPSVDTAIVVDEAPLPTAPLPQGGLRGFITALIVAFGAGFGISYMLEYIDYTIKTPQELDALYSLPTLGVISQIAGARDREVTHDEIVALSEPRSPAAEAFRSLRTNIQFASGGEPIRSLLITSAGPAEGKTMTSANLAVSLAQGGNRVILVDCDLRKPRQHRIFNVPKEPGFTNLIIDHPQQTSLPLAGGTEGGSHLTNHLRPTDQPNLWLLPCGTVPPNPSELLGTPRAADIMHQLNDHADIVIYDSPPLATVTDGAVLATRLDGVLQVVKAGSTRRDLVLRGRDVLDKVDARILGTVLNQVQLSDLGYYSYYYYYGHYQDGHGPDADEPRSLLDRILPNGRSQKHKRRRTNQLGPEPPTNQQTN